MWDETKHPRDLKGRFTYKEEFTRAQYIYNSDIPRSKFFQTQSRKISIPLSFFSNRKKNSLPQNSIPTSPRNATGINSERLYTEHHVQHAKDMGFKGQKEYQRAAIDFWENGKGKIYYGVDKKFYKYNENTMEFLAIRPDGQVLTYFLYDNKKFERKRIQTKLYEI